MLIRRMRITITRKIIAIDLKRLDMRLSNFWKWDRQVERVDKIGCAVNIKESDIERAIEKLLEDKCRLGTDWIYQDFSSINSPPVHRRSYTFRDSIDRIAVVELTGALIGLHDAVKHEYKIVDSVDSSDPIISRPPDFPS